MNYDTNIKLSAHTFERAPDAGGKQIATFMLHAPDVRVDPQKISFDWDALTQLRTVAAQPYAPPDASLALGRMLADILLPGDVRDYLKQALAAVKSRDTEGVRLRLALAGELQRVPWEFIALNLAGGEHTSQDFLALNPQLSIVRDPPQLDPLPPGKTDPDSAVRVLVAMASPTDLPSLDLDAEQAALETLLKRPGFEMRLLRPARAIDLVSGAFRAHIFHFAGHGDFAVDPISPVPGAISGAGQLMLEGDDRRSASMTGAELGLALASRRTKVAFLGACLSASRDDLNQWNGIAEALLKAGLRAVVGMQFTIKDDSAIAFVREFYDRLLSGATIDEAVQGGRLTLAVGKRDLRGFATPVLYLRDHDGFVLPQIEQVAATPARPVPIPQMFEALKTTTIDLQGSQGAVVNNSGTVNQQFGDTINTGGGDYVRGDKTNIDTGGGVYIAGNVTINGNFAGRDQIVNGGGDAGAGTDQQSDEPSDADKALIKKLYDILGGYRFGEGDLQDVAFRLSIDWDTLSGDEKRAKARSLVTESLRVDKLEALRALVKKLRPNVDI
jgi:hypothetical protein